MKRGGKLENPRVAIRMAEETRRRYEVTSVSSVHFFITHIYTYTCHNADAAELRLDVCVIKK